MRPGAAFTFPSNASTARYPLQLGRLEQCEEVSCSRKPTTDYPSNNLPFNAEYLNVALAKNPYRLRVMAFLINKHPRLIKIIDK